MCNFKVHIQGFVCNFKVINVLCSQANSTDWCLKKNKRKENHVDRRRRGKDHNLCYSLEYLQTVFCNDNVIVTVVRRELCSKGIFKDHLLNWKCHYFFYECMGLKKTNLSLLKCVTFSLVCVWVKSNWDNVTEFEVVFF